MGSGALSCVLSWWSIDSTSPGSLRLLRSSCIFCRRLRASSSMWPTWLSSSRSCILMDKKSEILRLSYNLDLVFQDASRQIALFVHTTTRSCVYYAASPLTVDVTRGAVNSQYSVNKPCISQTHIDRQFASSLFPSLFFGVPFELHPILDDSIHYACISSYALYFASHVTPILHQSVLSKIDSRVFQESGVPKSKSNYPKVHCKLVATCVHSPIYNSFAS